MSRQLRKCIILPEICNNNVHVLMELVGYSHNTVSEQWPADPVKSLRYILSLRSPVFRIILGILFRKNTASSVK